MQEMTAQSTSQDKSKPVKRELNDREKRRRAEKLRKAARRRRNARHG